MIGERLRRDDESSVLLPRGAFQVGRKREDVLLLPDVEKRIARLTSVAGGP